MKKPKKLRRLVLISVSLIFMLLLLGAGAYASMFDRRVQTPSAQSYQESHFPGLHSKEITFRSQNGTALAGRLYAAEGKNGTALVVLAHGMGFGHRAYLNVIAALANHGYLVFAYDATGYDDSGGGSAGGVPQVVMDLDAALKAAEALPEAAGLPVFLFGHSLGGYAVCAVLPEHPEVRAAAALAGFDSSSAWIRARFGLPGTLLIPGAALWERIRFGSAAGISATEGLERSAAKVLIVHSSDDDTVPISCGLDRYAARFGSDPRFTYLRLERGGHGAIFGGEITTACFALFDACASSYPFVFHAPHFRFMPA